LNNYYFRSFIAEVISNDLERQGINNPLLVWLSGKTGHFSRPELKNKKHQDADTDLRLIGVDNAQLSSIKLGIMGLKFTAHHDDMGGYRIELQRGNGSGSAFNLHDSRMILMALLTWKAKRLSVTPQYQPYLILPSTSCCVLVLRKASTSINQSGSK
jgi:hypothetical protein